MITDQVFSRACAVYTAHTQAGRGFFPTQGVSLIHLCSDVAGYGISLYIHTLFDVAHRVWIVRHMHTPRALAVSVRLADI